MSLHIRNLTDEKAYKAYYPALRSYFKKTFKTLDIKADYDVSVILVDEDKIHELNRDYRHIDRATDVITFAEIDSASELEEDELYLGDIFISTKAVKDQAAEYGHSEKRELCFLFVHGLLHTLGYDHMTKEDEEIMFGHQKAILEDLR